MTSIASSQLTGDNSGKQTTHTATQTIDPSGAATEIDAGQVGATLAAFIGGYTLPRIWQPLPQSSSTPQAPNWGTFASVRSTEMTGSV